MIDLKKIRRALTAMSHEDEECIEAEYATPAPFAADLHAVVDELESLRVALGRHDSQREERLTRYRCAALPTIIGRYHSDGAKDNAKSAEEMAHAMLAAERPAVAIDKETP